MEQNKLIQLARNQHLILSFIQEKLDIVNYILAGYENNEPIFMTNQFLHYTAHIYYRTIIVEFGALYINKLKNNKNNFHSYYKEKWVRDFLNEESINKIRGWLDDISHNIKRNEILRHNTIAHFNFDNIESKISFNFEGLVVLNELFEVGMKILSCVGDGKIDYSYKNDSYLTDLKRIIEDLSLLGIS